MARLNHPVYFTENQWQVREEDGTVTFGSITINSDGTMKFVPNPKIEAVVGNEEKPPPDLSDSLE